MSGQDCQKDIDKLTDLHNTAREKIH